MLINESRQLWTVPGHYGDGHQYQTDATRHESGWRIPRLAHGGRIEATRRVRRSRSGTCANGLLAGSEHFRVPSMASREDRIRRGRIRRGRGLTLRRATPRRAWTGHSRHRLPEPFSAPRVRSTYPPKQPDAMQIAAASTARMRDSGTTGSSLRCCLAVLRIRLLRSDAFGRPGDRADLDRKRRSFRCRHAYCLLQGTRKETSFRSDPRHLRSNEARRSSDAWRRRHRRVVRTSAQSTARVPRNRKHCDTRDAVRGLRALRACIVRTRLITEEGGRHDSRGVGRRS